MKDDFVHLSGAAELHDALGLLKKSTERALLRRVAIAALEPFVERAKQLVPVDSGELRDSIAVGTKLTRRARAAARADPVEGVRVFAGTADRNGVPREFGSVRSRPEPFMRPAWDGTKHEVLDRTMKGLRADIDRTAARAAKKRRG